MKNWKPLMMYVYNHSYLPTLSERLYMNRAKDSAMMTAFLLSFLMSTWALKHSVCIGQTHGDRLTSWFITHSWTESQGTINCITFFPLYPSGILFWDIHLFFFRLLVNNQFIRSFVHSSYYGWSVSPTLCPGWSRAVLTWGPPGGRVWIQGCGAWRSARAPRPRWAPPGWSSCGSCQTSPRGTWRRSPITATSKIHYHDPGP